MVQNFARIQDFVQQSNIRLPARMDDFLLYYYGQLNADACLVRSAYRQEFYEITFSLDLDCHFQVDNFTYAAERQALMIIGPGRLQSVHESTPSAHAGAGFSLFFHQDFLPGNLHRQNAFINSGYSPLVHLHPKAVAEVSRIFALLHYEYQEYGSAAKGTIQSLTTALLHKATSYFTGNAVVPPAMYREDELARNFEACVQENFLRYTTVKEYAAQLNVSDKYLSQSVKSATGRNALDIVSNARITHAQALLLHTNLSAVEVGHELNFATTDYFFTYFKKLTGLTPRQYKLENLK